MLFYAYFLTQNSGKILGPIAKLLGYLMNAIFNGLDAIGIPNIGLAIILFTLVIYIALMPLTIKQQKFSKLSAKMNPEIQEIQAKYKGKKDNESAMKMNEETKAVYEKYGVSPSGSCIQLVIQMPILFALYRVIYNIPAYVTKVYDVFNVLALKIVNSDSGQYIINAPEELKSVVSAVKQFSKNIDNNLSDGIIDVLNKTSSVDMAKLSEHYGLASLTYNDNGVDKLILSTSDQVGLIDKFNSFLGLNISNSPKDIIINSFHEGRYLLVAGAILVPLLAALTQWINTKLMPQAAENNDNQQQNSMQASMKTMNVMMPIMSAVFCFTLPCGMGIYWIAGAVIRSIQQILINKHLDKQDIDKIIEQNMEKAKKKREKKSVSSATIMSSANRNTKTISEKASTKTQEEKEAALKRVNDYYAKNGIKPGGIAAKAHMVKQYNEDQSSSDSDNDKS